MAVISGKGRNFPRPTSNAQDHTDFGTDGGAHNFLRYIEDWNGQTLNYRGSIVSFYISRQAVGTYKCCDVVYSPPSRGYHFDTDFLTPNLLPPRTPMFRDVNTLTFRQLLRPNPVAGALEAREVAASAMAAASRFPRDPAPPAEIPVPGRPFSR